MLLMDIGPVVKAMKYPSIDLNEETHPLLWQYKNVFVQDRHRRTFIVFISAKERPSMSPVMLVAGGSTPTLSKVKNASWFP